MESYFSIITLNISRSNAPVKRQRLAEWIQFNPYQTNNSILDRTRANHFTICMETNSHSNLEKEEWNWMNQPAWLQTIPQSYSHQNSMVLEKRQKYRSMEQNRKCRGKSHTYEHLIFDKGGQNIQWRRQSLQQVMLGKLVNYM